MGRSVVRAELVLGVMGLVLGALVGPAEAAKHTKPGPVSGLALSFTHPSDHYMVTAQWDPYPNATKYAVKMTDASGIAISPATTTDTTWTHSSYGAVGTAVTVSVTVYVGKVRGATAKVTALLPDVTAPVGAYSVLRDPNNPTGGDVTVQQDALSDDLDPLADLTQTINWGDGTPDESWSPLNTQIKHSYPGTQALYHPVVTIADLAGNTASYPLAVAVADTQAPTGTFTAGPPTGFSEWTTITVAQSALLDDLSSPADITRTVNWGDGSAPEAWTSGDTLDHVYSSAGEFTPTVTVTDEAGNTAVIGSSVITVTADTTTPALSIAKPKRSKSVRAWKHLHGAAADTGVGVQYANLKVIEKRRGVWFFYTFKGNTWEKVGTSKRAALRKAAVKVLRIDDLYHWSKKARGLRKGVLVVRATSADNVGNVAVVTVKKKLTKR